jgi:hypothetical protein
VVSTVLFLGGLIVSTVMAGGDTFPSPFSHAAVILAYFDKHPSAVRVGAFGQFGASVPLAIYAATASARLRNLGIRAPGATIALAGGLLGAAMLALSGLIAWVLSQPGVHDQRSIVPALRDFAFATGGVGHVVFLGLLVAGIAVPGLLAKLLPRYLAIAGLVIAAVAELSTLVLLISDAAILLPIARFTALAWLIATGFLLPRTRTNKSGTNVS